jgi:hypothetical protein
MFTKAFLGNTYNAMKCRIVNPDILDFDYNKKRQQLSASTSDFLIIDNKALGYRIKYLVYSFMTDEAGVTSYVGASSFEPMKGNGLQEKIWQNRRAKAHFGSTMHFLRSCIADLIKENGFIVRELIKPEYRPTDSLILQKIRHFRSRFYVNEHGYPDIQAQKDSIAYWEMMYSTSTKVATSIDRPLWPEEYIKLTNEKGIYAFGHHSKALLINYKQRINIVSFRSSFVTFLKPNVFFDSNGVIFTPGDCLFEGYWQHLRVGDQLPVDYELPQENAVQQASIPDQDVKTEH